MITVYVTLGNRLNPRISIRKVISGSTNFWTEFRIRNWNSEFGIGIRNSEFRNEKLFWDAPKCIFRRSDFFMYFPALQTLF